ncbi:MAG: D-glycero-beta-D-manno-heptose 1,7-bisphosphate 7-phosphatase [Proteobacteria bacterium]|nr:D-glycero-beta-D-manno-heptose 1,7-bisphosphate 7-phosphatase [Pseudomonadota bacterium]
MKLIILDRDGVINQDSDDFIKSPEEWLPIPGSLEAIALLNKLGFTVSVATNQSGVARQLFTLDTLSKIHQKMHDTLQAVGGKIDSIFYCPHGPDDNCDCRKPKPGLLLQIAKHYQISLKGIMVVGDSFRDLVAAQSVDAKPLLVKTGKGERTLAKHAEELKEIVVFPDLLSLAKAL